MHDSDTDPGIGSSAQAAPAPPPRHRSLDPSFFWGATSHHSPGISQKTVARRLQATYTKVDRRSAEQVGGELQGTG